MTTMRAFRILGWAHIRGHKSEYLAMLVISLMLGLVKAFDEPVVFDRLFLPHHFDYLQMTLQFRIIRGFLKPLLDFSIPGLFLYTVISERKSGRILLTYQLPCRNAFPLLVTLTTVVCMGSLIHFIGQLVYTAFIPRLWLSNLFTHDIKFFSNTLLLCGILCTIEGLMCFIKTNRMLAGYVFFIVVMLAFNMINDPIQYNICKYYNIFFGVLSWNLWFLLRLVFPGCAGLLFATAGLALTERYRDL